jgi:iron complex transport system substrate-binding protein
VVRIVSLLPSATEIVCSLGLANDLVGVTHECDYPPEVRTKAALTRSRLPDDARTPADVDRFVSASVDGGELIYELDVDQIRALDPDLILSQDLCRVCAVPSGHVTDALAVLGCSAAVLSLDAHTLDGVIETIVHVGEATGARATAIRMVMTLRARVDAVRRAAESLPRPRTLALEWSDPPFSGGHWVPEMIGIAGGSPLLSEPGMPSRRLSWEEIGAARPELVVFTPCGYALDRAADEGRAVIARPELRAARVVAVDANAVFSRPGPRLVDGLEALAWIQHPDRFAPPPPGTVIELRTRAGQGTTGG